MTHENKSISRRKFLQGASSAAALFTILPRHVLAQSGQTPPSEKLNIAGVGIGGQGANDLERVSSENIVALCDVDEAYAKPVFEKYPAARKWKDFREMLDKQKDIDAVVIATPDHLHAVIAYTALSLGKHVYGEKPLTQTVYQARKVRDAARRAKVATQMGNQGHSGEGARLMCEWIWDGAIGPVHEVHAWTNRAVWPQGIPRPTDTPSVPATLDWDGWLGPAPLRPYHPAYVPFNWRGWWDFGTGALGDHACHGLDPVFWSLKLGHPSSIEASSTPDNGDSYPSGSIIIYEFPAREGMPPLKLTWYDGSLRPPHPEELEPERKLTKNGVFFIGEKGKLMCGGWADSPRLIPEKRMEEYRRPAKTIPRSPGHHQEWVEACKNGTPTGSNFDYASALTEMVLLGNIAVRMQDKLYWDGEKFSNDAANQWLTLPARKGWEI